MHRIIHSSFEIDLSHNEEISINEENNWFSDKYFTKYVLPFPLYISDELNEAFGDILSHNSTNKQTLFTVRYMHLGKNHEAILEIGDREGREAQAEVRFGMEELPNYNKKLSELPLDDFEIEDPDTIYTHAASVITQTWPAVTHNFVAVHANKFSTEEEQWEAFQGLINKHVSGNFIENEYDDIDDKQLNRNIMQPQPYLMHVLEKGFEDAGFSMAGEFTEHAKWKTALFSEISDYFTTINTNSEILQMHSGEYDSVNSANRGTYSREIVLDTKGRYKIAGNIILRLYRFPGYVKIKFNGTTIWSSSFVSLLGYKEKFYTPDINVDFTSGATATITFESEQFIYQKLGDEYLENANICDLSITQLAEYDSEGNFVPTLITPNEVKLTKCVPDMEFGKLLTELKNWVNLDIYPKDGVVYMNFIENQLENEPIVDLSDFEIEQPIITSSQSNTFLLKFQDIESEEYTFEELFISESETITSGYIKENDTKEIVINGLPLPLALKNGILTADQFIDDDAKLKFIFFDGTATDSVANAAKSGDDALIPNIYDNFYKKWLYIRIFGENYKWSFNIIEEKLRDLLVRSRIYAYNKKHIIKTLKKDQINPGIWNVEIQAETLKHSVN